MKKVYVGFLTIVMFASLLVSSIAYADTSEESQSLLDKVWNWNGPVVYNGEGLISTTVTYSNISSPSGTLQQGIVFPFTGTLKLQSLTGGLGNSHFKNLEFRVWNPTYSDYGVVGSHDIAKRTYQFSESHKKIRIEDYASEIARDIANLPVGDYFYTLKVTYRGKLWDDTETIANTKFSISNDGEEYEKPKISISGATKTSAITAGSGFTISGTVKTSCGNLSQVDVLLDGVTVRSFTPNSSSFELGVFVGKMDETKQLDGGTHRYQVIVSAENGYHQVTETVIDQKVAVSGTLPENSTSVERAYELTIESVSAPVEIEQGDNFGLRGVIKVENATLIRVDGQIIDASGKVVMSGSHSLNTNSHDIRKSINNDLLFGKLGIGQYTYVLTATVMTNNGQEINETLIRKNFSVFSRSSTNDENKQSGVSTPSDSSNGSITQEETSADKEWGEWSKWSTTPVAESSTRQVETKTVTETKVTYTYKHWHYTHKKNGPQNSYAEYKGSQYVEGSGKWEYKTVDSPLKQTDTKDGHKRYKVNGVSWYHEQKNETTEEVTYYRYRDQK